MRRIPYPTPGEILLEEFLKPMGITQYRLAKEIGVPQRRIGEIVAGKRAVTADTGLRLAQFFGTSRASGRGCRMIMTGRPPRTRSKRPCARSRRGTSDTRLRDLDAA
ncbi:hypothetical protein RLIN73S_01929 [Rhodanobacter lindaniclasticus]